MFQKDKQGIMQQLISQLSGSMVDPSKDPFEFAGYIESKEYEKAYGMLLPSIKEQQTIEDFINTITKDFEVSDPISENRFQADQKIYKDVAIQFAELLVEKEYDKAHKLLSSSLRKQYKPEKLQKRMEKMMDWLHDVEWGVEKDWVYEEGAIDDQYIYVPIVEEAISVKVDYRKDKLVITEIEWGRP